MKEYRKLLKTLPIKEGLNLTLRVIESNDVFHFKSRYENLEREKRNGLLSHEEYINSWSQLCYNWLEQIDQFSDEEIQQIIAQSYLKLKPAGLLSKLQAASIRLSEWKSDFENIPDSHIERTQTTQIINWANTKLNPDEKGIALLVGDAGAGKSVIMHDLLKTFERLGTPVLGIKADQYCVETIEMLENRLNLKEGIEDVIRVLAQINDRVIVLIDQIDALSQSLSARREYLETFTRLVLLLSSIPEVRIVISCRTYDLQNDHEFSFYRRQKRFKVGQLNIEEVKVILTKLSREMPKLPTDLLELLKTPLHLNVFCQIYRSDLPFDRINVLYDLYEEFWYQKVQQSYSTDDVPLKADRIAKLIFGLAHTMYDRQNLAVSANLFRTEFSSELVFLKSEGIVIESREGLAFFHQTFYDFAYAKQFVNSGIPIEKYLLDNGQNLHIRSCLKMMLEFSSKNDHDEYLRVLKTILTSSQFYFHIKSLLLSLLGFVKKPSYKEIHFVRDFILNEPSLFKAFIYSVRSREWLLFLLEENQPQRLLEFETGNSVIVKDSKMREQFSNQLNILNGFLLRHLPESRNEILAFISDLPEFEGKPWLVERILNAIEIWDNKLAFKLFDCNSEKFVDVFFNKFLENAAKSNLSWALEHLATSIEKVIDTMGSRGEVNFDHPLSELISHFIKNYPEPTFNLLLRLQRKRLFISDDVKRADSPNVIYNDFPWFSMSIEDRDGANKGLFSHLIESTRIIAKNKSTHFTNFISESINSHSATELLILVEGFRANPNAMAAEIYSFFHLFFEKQGIDAQDLLSWRTRQLLKEVFPHFTIEQKQNIIQLVSQIESEYEKDWAIRNKKPEAIGVTQLRWLKYLPKSDIEQHQEAKHTYLELTQRFPDLSDNEPNKIRIRSIGPPMEQSEYEKMTKKEWKESFIKYNENYEVEWGSNKGGMEEHARKFEEEVKKNPNIFYTLVDDLILLNSIPRTYLLHGLDGLKGAKYSPEQILKLLKKIDYNGFDSWEVIKLVNLCGYIINSKIEDDFLVNFLVNIANSHIDPSDDALKIRIESNESESTYTSGFNTVRGSAVRLLPHLYYFKKHQNLLFETLEYVAEQDFLSIRCQIMPSLALLTNLDKVRSLRLFLRLIQDNEEAIMEYSAWSAKYFTFQNFEGMKPYFEKALYFPKLHKDAAVILSLLWIFKQDEALNLLDQFIEISEEAKAGTIEVAAKNISDTNGTPIVKSIELLERFLEETSEEVAKSYDYAFHDFKPDNFLHLQPFLVQFSQTNINKKNPRPFYSYLISCARSYPETCLELMGNFEQYEKPDIRYSGYYDKEPLKVVINAYNGLWGKRIKNLELLKKALLLFDKMLLDDRFRRDAEIILVETER